MNCENTPIQLVCFDLGGVLVRIADDWSDACRRANLTLPEHLLRRASEIDLTDISHAFEVGDINDTTFCAAVSNLFDELEAQHVATMLDGWLQGMYDGVEPLLDQLEQRRVTTACLSNTNHRHWRTMTSGGIYAPLDRLHHRFASHLAAQRKPGEPAYRNVEQRLNLPPGAILFFDDRADNVAAAARCGWVAHQVDPTHDPVAQMSGLLSECGVL